MLAIHRIGCFKVVGGRSQLALAQVHIIAEEGFSASSAKLYNEARSGYPAEAI